VEEGDEEGEQRVEEEIGDRQEVARPNLLGMRVQEGLPGLPSWPGGAHGSHVLLLGAKASADAQLEPFAPDAFCSEDGGYPLPTL